MSEEQKKAVWPWVVALLIGLPLPYVLSSGPMRTVAFRNKELVGITLDGKKEFAHLEQGTWWPKLYAPVVWISEQPFGGSVKRYWGLFPILDEIE